MAPEHTSTSGSGGSGRCRHCGARLHPGAQWCTLCHKRTGPPPPPVVSSRGTGSAPVPPTEPTGSPGHANQPAEPGLGSLPGPRDPLPEEGPRTTQPASKKPATAVDPEQAEQLAEAMVAKLRQQDSATKAPEAMRNRGIRVAIIVGGSMFVIAVLLGLAVVLG